MKIKKKKSTIPLIIFLSFLIVLGAIYFGGSILQVSRYEIVSSKIPESFRDFKILQLSDLHSKSFGKDNYGLLKRIDREKPDIIAMTGDMINTKDTDFKVFMDLAKELSEKYQIYYVVGNHEENLSGNKLKSLSEELSSIGIRVLDNERVTITKGNDSINIYGLWFNLRYYKDAGSEYAKDVFFGQSQIDSILGSLDNNSYNILLTHNPVYFDTYSSWGADLTLSGHMHGGMIRIPFAGGLLSPEKEFFPKYNSGKYQINKSVLIVNRGLGNGDFGIRLFNPPDVSVITLSN
jgi:Predicted phosphohydrolases